jgi:imidazolonepropionase-like amidohydrolase
MMLHPWGCRRMALAVLASACVASAQARDLIVHASHLIDGLSPAALGESSIIIKDDRIERVQPGFVQREGYEIIDLSRDTVLPGLIDLHTHLSLGAMASNPLKGGETIRHPQ